MKHLLIVDDDPNILELLSEVFSGLVDRVTFANNGREAQEILTSLQSINCILSDISMPECDGFMLLEHSKCHHPHIPFVLLSAYGSDNNISKAKKLGAHAFVNKTEWDQVIKVVEDIFKKD